MKKITDKTLQDTGERMIPAYHVGNMVYGEHIVRYEAALPLVKDKVVLDIASGSGYGTDLLASTAKKVYGVDVDKDALDYAKKNYGSKKVEFLLGDAIKIPLDDNSVDVVVSFETLEHIRDYKKFMDEIRRVLKKDGLLILSTPNDVEFPETNHFHIHEFEQKELEGLVKRYFKNTKMYLQGTWLYNALVDEGMLTKSWRQPIDTIQTAPIDAKRCIYFYMLCSNRKLAEEVKPLSAMSQHWSARRAQEDDQHIRDHIEEQGKVMRHLENEVHLRDERIKALEGELHSVRKRLDSIGALPGKIVNRLTHPKKK